MKKKRSSSSIRWLSEHFKDSYVKNAHLNNLRSRAWFKINEIQLKYQVFKSGMNIIDLGSSPGSWSQYALQKIGKKGSIIACDMKSMHAIKGVFFIQGDITKKKILEDLYNCIKNTKINLIMSDMSPNITGISDIDMANIFNLSNSVLNICINILCKKGIFIIKLFQGREFEDYLRKIRYFFEKIKIYKPRSSRNRSREIFLIAIGKKI